MKTYVAEIAGEAILAFRAEDDEAGRGRLSARCSRLLRPSRARRTPIVGRQVRYGTAWPLLPNTSNGSFCATRRPEGRTIAMIGSFTLSLLSLSMRAVRKTTDEDQAGTWPIAGRKSSRDPSAWSRDWIKITNPDSPAMVRARDGKWQLETEALRSVGDGGGVAIGEPRRGQTRPLLSRRLGGAIAWTASS
jgi:hypothetical protein